MRIAHRLLGAASVLLAGALPARANGAAPAQSTETPFELRVATVNMWTIPRVSTYMDERLGALAERLEASDLDVVGLQEMWADAPRRVFLDRVRASFPYQMDFEALSGGSGLVILSRHPIAQSGFRAFPANGKWWNLHHGDWWGRKGVGVVQLETPAGPVWFATTHLIAHYVPRPEGGNGMDDQYAYDRWHQIHVVRELVARHAGDAPAIVVGDFNFRPGTTYYRFLSAPWTACGAGGGGGASWDPSWVEAGSESGRPRRIDMMWIRPGATATWTVDTAPHVIFEEPVPVGDAPPQRLTDHPAMAAVLRLVSAAPDSVSGHAATAALSSNAATLGLGRGIVDTVGLNAAAGHGASLAGAALAAAVCFGLGGAIIPRRRPESHVWRAVLRGVVGAGFLFLGFAMLRGTVENGRTLAASYAFWLETKDCLPAPEVKAEARADL